MTWNLIVIGGGAAGFFGAITHAERGGGSTLILEQSQGVLGKVRISGGGRCNVTHRWVDPQVFSGNYPRGEKALIGPLHRWGAEDTVNWFASRGVALKTEADGRLFPVTDCSQTIIDCLTEAAEAAGVVVRTGCCVSRIERVEGGADAAGFSVSAGKGEVLRARKVLLATGGTRAASGARLAEQLGHALEPAVPSLFTFRIQDARIAGLQGVSVADVSCRIADAGSRLVSSGPLLITHWGVSGPGILRLSAWGARELAGRGYQFTLQVNWIPGGDVAGVLQRARNDWRKRQVHTRCPFPAIPRRLWERLLAAAGIDEDAVWARLTRVQMSALTGQLCDGRFRVTGKSLNKEEFVTCGGVRLADIDLRTMQSRRCRGLFFAGEVMDVDGITGGFNFQNAWTSGHLAGVAMADAADSPPS